MSTVQHVVTDTDQGTWIESLSISSDQHAIPEVRDNWKIEKQRLRGGLSDGVDVVELDNGRVAFSVIPTRGMGLWRGRCDSTEIGWQSPVRRPVHPGFVNLNDRSGLGWLTGFQELLCRCGLSSNGAPGTDVILDNQGNRTESQLTLHGRIANLAAHYVEVGANEDRLWVTGEVDETMLFGPCLTLRSTVSLPWGEKRLEIRDEVINRAGQSCEWQLLYHLNVGAPILSADSRFYAAAAEVAPRDDVAAVEMSEYDRFPAPTTGFREQVFFFRLADNESGRAQVLLADPAASLGLGLAFATNELPCFSLWKNPQAAADGYVVGLEPATNYPNLKTFERQHGRVGVLEPGESRTMTLEIQVATHDDELAKLREPILQQAGAVETQIHTAPMANWSG